MATVSAAAARLWEEAARVEAAAELEAGLPASAGALASAVEELLASADLVQAPPRVAWRLLWLAADLTQHVDVYRAGALLSAVEKLLQRATPAAPTDGDFAEAAEMAFDFFFNRPLDGGGQPLAWHRFDDCVATLERLLAGEARVARRAALHGLSHLKQHALLPAQRLRIDVVLDAFQRDNRDPSLAAYAVRAKRAELD